METEVAKNAAPGEAHRPNGAGEHPDALIDALPSGILVIDRDYRIQRANRHVATWLRRSPAEMRGQHCYRLVHGRDAPCDDCPSATAFHTGEPATVVHTGLDAGGGMTHAEIIAFPIRDATGRVVQALESVRDITERERHLAQLADAVARLETSQRELERRNEELEQLNALLGRTSCTMGVDAVLSTLLAGALRLVGPGTSGAILLLEEPGRRLRIASTRGLEDAFFPCEKAVALGECLCGAAALSGEVISAGGPSEPWFPGCPPGGPGASLAVPLHASARVIGALVIHMPPGVTPPAGRERLFELMGRQVGIAIENAQLYERADAQLRRKVAELTRALGALEEERARARASEAGKEELVTMLSHDLRSPLSVILTDAGELGRPCGDEGCRAARVAIRQSVRRAAAMLDDVVDSARLESGSLDLKREALDLAAILRDLVEGGFPAPERDRLRLALDLPSAAMLGDRSWLERAAANVIGNALKFAPAETPVRVRLARDGLALRLEVTDQGPGIPADEQPLLFRRFFRASNVKRTGGSGLGLYIVRLVVEAHGGRAAVRSELGRGTTVTLTLPAAA
jgi:PAS domain S-box-containing protein